MEASVNGGATVGERLAGGKRPVVGEATGFQGSATPSTFAKLPDREWPLDRGVVIPGRRRTEFDDASRGGEETWVREAGVLVALWEPRLFL